MIEEGADVHAGDDCALRWAAYNGNLEVVKILIENGADIHANNDWALKEASFYGHSEVVKFLIENGASNIDGTIEDATERARAWGQVEMVDYLKSLKQQNNYKE